MKIIQTNGDRNVFREGRSEPSRQHFTEAWVKIINGQEKEKIISLEGK